jgi:hypothetical protein
MTSYSPVALSALASVMAPLINSAVVTVAGQAGNVTAAQIASAVLTPSFFDAAFRTWLAGLPTTLPSTPGVTWNNGGIPAVS